MQALKILAALAIVILGFVVLRWVAAVTVAPTAPAAARSTSSGGDFPSVPVPSGVEPTPEPTEEVDRLAAYDEAMRLARDSVAEDDFETARELYFLAGEALPGDPEAAARTRQVETVLGIDDRSAGWREALDDVEDLMVLAPRSPTIGRAYIEALVGAGREALDQDNMPRAERLCAEAAQRAPTRNDARLCVSQSAATATAMAVVTLTPRPSATSRPAPSATPVPSATPLFAVDRP